MRNPLLIIAIVLFIGVPHAVFAQPEIKSATYSVTEVYQYNFQVVRISGRSMTVDIEDFGRRRFDVPRDFTFEIDGEDKTLNQLLPGQRLRAYVTHTETGELMLVQDGETTVGVLAESVDDTEMNAAADPVVPAAAMEEPEQEPAPTELPKTAGQVGWLLLAGFVLILSSVLSARRRQRSSP